MGNADNPRMLTEHDVLFDYWWGRYVMGLTHEEIAAGAASSAALRAAETAWKASAFTFARRGGSGRRVGRPGAE